ncbi:lamina-associated polypeptide 2, isoforms beta/gamma-like isoform X2 [Myxocyprinus asiaticus]|uniref:lamina-associated polypeptide 2, isoforms beta/gamma-like isoform X2 n=1 Tax=Myxocyprinus asiaticus TaxID=70543 RepID=UPI002223CA65|nr:lamina-associated polypeptide 2, isoforms beta/gamma-like isoform X2 [Myxocyprinus asiaticus]
MSEFLDDPSVLTKDKLKSALMAHNVVLPNGDQRKDVFVQLYLKNLTAQNKKSSGSPDVFSSDEELPPTPVISNKSRSGRKATRKTDKVRPEEIDVTELTNEGLKDLLLKYGLNAGPIVASTRKVYEKRLQKLLDLGPPEKVAPPSDVSHVDGNHNGNTDSDQYSDKEEETVAPAPVSVPEPEPEVEAEPIPVVERPVRSREKIQVTTRTRGSQHNRVEKVSAVDQTPRTVERDVLEEIFSNENLSTPTGISATCRRPIRGAAGRPVVDTKLDESRFHLAELRETNTSYTETRSVPWAATVPLTASKPLAPPAVKTRARRGLPVWVQLVLLSAVAVFLFFVYQAMETNEVGLFKQSGADDSTSK